MKKRLICMLLSVLVIVSLFAGISVSASAETVSYSTMTYRMVSGDYVLRICQRLGLNYYVCKTSIMKLNNITNEDQFRHLPVGKLLTLPSTDADAVVITTGHGSTAKTTTTATTNTAVTSTIAAATPTKATVSASSSGDPIWFWIVPYELRSGETISDAMNALGMEGNAFRDTIQKINQIKDWGSSRTNSSILLPTYYPPASGFSRVTVYAHVMRAGETPANVVTSRGLDYTKIKPMLDILNEKYGGVANVQTGQRLFYPIASTGKVYGDDSAEGYYKLNSGLSTADGTVEFYVNDKRVYSAKPGTTVKFVLKPASGKAVKDVVLKYANGQADLYLKGNSFTMPSCDVRLDASFQSGHKITLKANYDGKAAVRVDGVNVSSAAKGARVMVASTDSTLAVSEAYVSYMTLTGLKREQLTNVDNGFVMPDADVTVEVVLKNLPTYPFYIINNKANNDGAFGSYSLEVDGVKVTSAARGAQVKIAPVPDTGYTVGAIVVTRHDNGQNVGVYNNTFVMPNVGVDVFVRFDPKGNNILINPVEGGEFWATLGGQDVKANRVDEAGTNQRVYLNWQADASQNGYTLSSNPDDYVVTRNKDGLRISVSVDKTDPKNPIVTFPMPAGGATVTGGVQRNTQTYKVRLFIDGSEVTKFNDLSFYTKGDLIKDAEGDLQRYEFQTSGAPVVPAGSPAAVQSMVGETITLSYNGGKNISKARYEVWSDEDTPVRLAEPTSQAGNSDSFTMPGQNVVIYAYFTSGTVRLSAENMHVKVPGSGSVGVMDQDGNSVGGVKVGEPFVLTLSPSAGYFFKTDWEKDGGEPRLVVKRKDNGGEILPVGGPTPGPNTELNPNEVQYSYASMPDCSIDVYVIFDKVPYTLKLNAVDEDGNNLTGGGFWILYINGVDFPIENNTSTVNAEFGDEVVADLTHTGASRYTVVKLIVNENITFTPPYLKFSIAGDLANAENQTIPVTMVLRRVEDSNPFNPFELIATSSNKAWGNASFFIVKSPTHPETESLTTFAYRCYAHDIIAIKPQGVTPAEYAVDGDNIRIDRWQGGSIVPTADTTLIPGETLYTFEMPSDSYKCIYVPFVPRTYDLTVNTNPTKAAPGLIKVVYEDGSSSDVMKPETFKGAPFGSKISVVLTDSGAAHNVHIDADASLATVAVADENKGKTSNGFWFKMPAKDISFTVVLRDKDGATTGVPTGEPDPIDVTLPATAKIDGGSLKLKFVTEDNKTVAGGTKVKSGTKLKVVVDEELPVGKALDGPISFLNGTTELTTANDGAFFTVPGGTADYTLTAEAKLVSKQYWVKINVENAPADAKLTVQVGSGAAVSVTPGVPLSPQVPHGTTITFNAATGSSRDIGSVDGMTVTGTLPAKTASGKLEPADKNDGDTVTLTVKFAATEYTLKSASEEGYALKYYTDPAMTAESEITTGKAAEGTTLYVEAVVEDANYVTKITITDDRATDNVSTLNGNGEAYVVNGNMTKAEVAKDAKVISATITYNNAPAGLKTEVNSGGKVEGSSVSVTGIKDANKVLTILLHEPADFAFGDTAGGDTGKFTATKDEFYKYTVTIDFAKVANDDNVNVELDIVTPTYTLPDKTDSSVPLEWFKSDLTTKVDINNVPYGTEVYCKATLASTRYVTQIKINDQTFTTPKNNVFFGPYKVTSSVDKTKVVPSGADKTVTITGITVPEGATDVKYFVKPDGGSYSQKVLAELTGLKNGDMLKVEVTGATIGSASTVNGLDLVGIDNGSTPATYEAKVNTTVLTNPATSISVTLNP